MWKRITNGLKNIRNSVVPGPPGSSNLNYESVFRGNEDRYIDPLIRDGVNDVRVPLWRERVALEDPLASMFFWDFGFYGWSKYPKFYGVIVPPIQGGVSIPGKASGVMLNAG